MPSNNDLIENFLEDCGVKHSQLGFKYLETAFMILGVDSRRRATLSEVYKQVADRYDVKPKSVEKAIAYSIKDHGITNKEFIFRAIDKGFVHSRPEFISLKNESSQSAVFYSFLEKGNLNEEGYTHASESKRKIRANRAAIWASSRK